MNALRKYRVQLMGGPADGESYTLPPAEAYYYHLWMQKVDGRMQECMMVEYALPDMRNTKGKVYKYAGISSTTMKTPDGIMLCNFLGLLN